MNRPHHHKIFGYPPRSHSVVFLEISHSRLMKKGAPGIPAGALFFFAEAWAQWQITPSGVMQQVTLPACQQLPA